MLTYSKSQTGRWHSESSTPCQDCSSAFELPSSGAVVMVADGLGSCKHSDLGSQEAVSAAASVLKAMNTTGTGEHALGIAQAYIQVAFAEAEAAVARIAERDGEPVEDYLTTLSVAYHNGRNLVWGHSGDGAVIAVTSFGTIRKLTEEDNGETSSIVYPLQAGPSHWSFGRDSQEEYAGVLAVTDGLLEALQPQLLRGSLYERLCAHLFQVGMADDLANGLTAANAVFSLDNTGCALFDLWSREIHRKSPKSEGLLRDDLSLAIATNPELMALVDCEYPEPDWLKLAIALNEDLTHLDACNQEEQ